ncbi:MAG TPA: potassium/proton antiporter [Candidatus Borkfalkia excrementipullorum]|nr:potassium/proton antiporter [Candidatus Borkfalkia excrementipullorum]
MEYVYLLLLLGVVVALCIFINRITDKLKVPSLLLFIGLGMVFGVLLRPQIGNFTDYNFGNIVCSVCLVFVIFYGGFGTNYKAAKPVAPQALLLSFAGTALTAGIIGVFVYYVFRLLPFFDGGIGWAESMLIGSVICSTDAASVFNILRSRRLNLKYGTSSMLEMESGSNDPMSYMLTVVFTAVIAAQYGISGSSMSAGEIVGMLFSQVGFGALFGVGFGFAGVYLMRKFSGDGGQRGAIFIFALALITYALPTLLGEITGVAWLAGNGYLGVYICGIMLGNARIPQKRDCVRFFDALTGVAQMIIFFLLGFLATPEWLIRPQVLVPAVLIFLFLTIVARPVAVAGLLAPFRAKWNQIGVVSWAGLRGVASIVFAIYAISSLPAAEGASAESMLPYELFSIVFVIVIISILVQGTLLPLMSKKLNMLGDTDDVLRTFNDYTEASDVSFVKVVVGENHPWAGKKLRQCVMPREFLVVLLLRGEEVIVPNGNTLVNAGDVLVTAAPEFENREDFGMFEEFIGKNHAWTGKKVRELELEPGTLIAMIKRGGGTVIPYGATEIAEGDSLVCIKIPPKEEPPEGDGGTPAVENPAGEGPAEGEAAVSAEK